jgi:hypothetical protein
MFFLTLALLSAPSTCTEVKQQCRACPTAGSVKGCSTVGIACQPTRRICEPAVPSKTVARADFRVEKRAR